VAPIEKVSASNHVAADATTVRDITMRRGTIQDAERVSSLVTALSEEFIVGEFTPQGRAYFLREHTPAEVRKRLAGDFRFYLAEDGNDLVAVAAIRGNVHLYYLFVAKPHQGSGLARRLWLQVQADSVALGNPGSFTVNASNYAVAAYERFGFRRVEPTQERNGVLYNPMRFVGIR
jgi:ribosomal protein S18 acetylase RimI-like enzyme